MIYGVLFLLFACGENDLENTDDSTETDKAQDSEGADSEQPTTETATETEVQPRQKQWKKSRKQQLRISRNMPVPCRMLMPQQYNSPLPNQKRVKFCSYQHPQKDFGSNERKAKKAG